MSSPESAPAGGPLLHGSFSMVDGYQYALLASFTRNVWSRTHLEKRSDASTTPVSMSARPAFSTTEGTCDFGTH